MCFEYSNIIVYVHSVGLLLTFLFFHNGGIHFHPEMTEELFHLNTMFYEIHEIYFILFFDTMIFFCNSSNGDVVTGALKVRIFWYGVTHM